MANHILNLRNKMRTSNKKEKVALDSINVGSLDKRHLVLLNHTQNSDPFTHGGLILSFISLGLKT